MHFFQIFGDKIYYIGLYVDDLIHVCDDEIGGIVADQLTKRYGSMDHHFGSSLSFLSINIFYDFNNGVLIMDQNAYIVKFLEVVDESCGKSMQQYPTGVDFELDLNGEDESKLLEQDLSIMNTVLYLIFCLEFNVF